LSELFETHQSRSTLLNLQLKPWQGTLKLKEGPIYLCDKSMHKSMQHV